MVGKAYTHFLALALFLIAACASIGTQPRGASDLQSDVTASRSISHSHHALAVDGGAAHPAGHVLCGPDPCGAAFVVAGAGLALGAIDVPARADAFSGAASRAFVAGESSNSALAHRRVTVLLI